MSHRLHIEIGKLGEETALPALPLCTATAHTFAARFETEEAKHRARRRALQLGWIELMRHFCAFDTIVACEDSTVTLQCKIQQRATSIQGYRSSTAR